MNAIMRCPENLDPEDREEEALVEGAQGALPFVLKKLRPRHMAALALVAQGYKNTEVSAMVDYTPQYVGMLLRQPVCIEYIRGLNEAVAVQLEAQFGAVADVINTGLRDGNTGEKLKAARLHLEVTKRIGSGRETIPTGQSSDERLASLAHRLLDLMGAKRNEHEGKPALQGESVVLGSELREQGQGRQALSWEGAEGHEESREGQ